MRRRILFVSENVTLAQVVRLVTLARSLDPGRYDVHFACAGFESLIFDGTHFSRWPLRTLPRELVDRALASGKRLYETKHLADYLESDLEVIDAVRPELVVGDFRWSLAVSCPLAGVAQATLVNACWSPFAERDGFPLPEHPIVDLLGVELAARYLPKALPTVFDHFAKPLNTLRKNHGLPALRGLPELLCHGDYTLYPDVPEVAPTRALPESHRYLGHVPWSPSVPLPSTDAFDPDLPIVYVTLGSSGKHDRLPLVLGALERLPVNVLLSTAGRAAPPPHPRRIAAPFLAGDLAARLASVVICNGGASTAYQALTEGRPVLGIPYNLDQYLVMTSLEKTGAGTLLRSGTLTEQGVQVALERLLGSAEQRASAAELARAFARYDCAERFGAFVESALTASAPPASGPRTAPPGSPSRADPKDRRRALS